jgi:hypothetical protein
MLRHFPLYSTASNITRKLLSNNNKATFSPPPQQFEYVLFGPSTGTIDVPSSITTIKIAGVAAGGACGPGKGGGGGGASNIRGNTFPASGVTSIYYSIGGDATTAGGAGADTFVKSNGAGGADIIRLVGGGTGAGPSWPNPSVAGAGGPVTGGGPNAIAGTPGGVGAGRYATGGAAPAATAGGTAGGGGGGGDADNGLAGYAGGAGGSSDTAPIYPSVISTISIGPAPSTWSFKNGSTTGGSGGPGSPGVSGSIAPDGGSVSYSTGGQGGTANPFTGAGGGGGAGAGIVFNDPANPTQNGKAFGGGGGGVGSGGSNSGAGGRGLLVIQLLF